MPGVEDADRAQRPTPWWKEGWLIGALLRTAVDVIIRLFWHDGGSR